MKVKFKNGYSVFIKDSDVKDLKKKQIFDYARKAVREVSKQKFKDASLGRVSPSEATNVSFKITLLKNAFKTGDDARLENEVTFLLRDLKADADESHKRYTTQFQPETIDALIAKYQEAVDFLTKINHPSASEAAELLHTVKGVMKKGPEHYVLTNTDTDEKYEFTNLERAKHYAENLRNSGATVTIVNSFSGETIEDACGKKTVKDIPYYDPDEAPRIQGSSYSPERLMKEIRYVGTGEDGANIMEIQDLYAEIDEFIAQGYKGLVDSGYSKEDGKRVIAGRYGTILTELRKSKLTDIANTLRRKIKELEKAWHLDTVRR